MPGSLNGLRLTIRHPSFRSRNLYFSLIVQRRGKGLVINQQDIRARERRRHRGTRQEVVAQQGHRAWFQTPELTAGVELSQLGGGEGAGVLHDFAAEGLAAGFERGLEDAVADAGAEVDEDVVGLEAGGFEDFGEEFGQELAVDVVGEAFVLADEVDGGGDGAGVDLVFDDVFD